VKKLFVTVLFVGIGSGLWWMLSHTARFSVKKWDAKFETVLRSSLAGFGLTNQDLVSSVHEVKKDKNGEWVAHSLVVRPIDKEKISELKKALEASGAKIEETIQDKTPVLLVKRGHRIYQEIRFAK
jgi:hypothetical protein